MAAPVQNPPISQQELNRLVEIDNKLKPYVSGSIKEATQKFSVEVFMHIINNQVQDLDLKTKDVEVLKAERGTSEKVNMVFQRLFDTSKILMDKTNMTPMIKEKLGLALYEKALSNKVLDESISLTQRLEKELPESLEDERFWQLV